MERCGAMRRGRYAVATKPKKRAGKKGRPAVFLDRDGTLTRQVGYVNHPARLMTFPFAARSVRALNEAGIPVVLVTNQSGVARGYFDEEILEKTHERMRRLLGLGGAKLDGIYVCPHHPTEGPKPRRCRCRKPGTGLVRRAARELGLDPSRSFMIGDTMGDIQLAKKVGATSILVLTGYGKGEKNYRRPHWKTEPDQICRNLEKAVEWILKQKV